MRTHALWRLLLRAFGRGYNVNHGPHAKTTCLHIQCPALVIVPLQEADVLNSQNEGHLAPGQTQVGNTKKDLD